MPAAPLLRGNLHRLAAGISRLRRGDLFHRRLLRDGPQTKAVLHHGRIYGWPSADGFMWTAALAGMFVYSIVFELSVGYLLVFFLVAAALLSLNYAFLSLQGLECTCHSPAAVFAGHRAIFTVTVRNPTARPRYGITIGPFRTEAEPFHLPPLASREIQIAIDAPKRGWLQAPHLVIGTTFPLGWWRVWSYWIPSARCLIYPAPEASPAPPPSTYAEGNSVTVNGNDTLAGLRIYRAGDPLRHASWRHAAKRPEAPLLTRMFDAGRSDARHFSLEQTSAAMPFEQRLSRLCAWICRADAAGERYSLALPGQRVGVGQGIEHRATCLRLLAVATESGSHE